MANVSRNFTSLTDITLDTSFVWCTWPSSSSEETPECENPCTIEINDTFKDLKYVEGFFDVDCNPIILRHEYDWAGNITDVRYISASGAIYTWELKTAKDCSCSGCEGMSININKTLKDLKYVEGFFDVDCDPIILRHEYDDCGSLIDVKYMYPSGELYTGEVKTLLECPIPDSVTPGIGEIVISEPWSYIFPEAAKSVSIRSNDSSWTYTLDGINNFSPSTFREGETVVHEFSQSSIITGITVISMTGSWILVTHIDG